MKCKEYGTVCNYNPAYPALHMAPNGASKPEDHVLQLSLCSEHQTVLGILNNSTTIFNNNTTSLAHQSLMSDRFISIGISRHYIFSMHDLELMHKFKTQTMFTLVQPCADKSMQVYRNAYAKLAYSVG